jgi:hypothetical protein
VTTLAALGLTVVMLLVLAIVASFRVVGAALVLGALAAFVAWGRARAVPVSPW